MVNIFNKPLINSPILSVTHCNKKNRFLTKMVIYVENSGFYPLMLIIYSVIVLLK